MALIGYLDSCVLAGSVVNGIHAKLSHKLR